jgi:hypothetical protein
MVSNLGMESIENGGLAFSKGFLSFSPFATTLRNSDCR